MDGFLSIDNSGSPWYVPTYRISLDEFIRIPALYLLVVFLLFLIWGGLVVRRENCFGWAVEIIADLTSFRLFSLSVYFFQKSIHHPFIFSISFSIFMLHKLLDSWFSRDSRLRWDSYRSFPLDRPQDSSPNILPFRGWASNSSPGLGIPIRESEMLKFGADSDISPQLFFSKVFRRLQSASPYKPIPIQTFCHLQKYVGKIHLVSFVFFKNICTYFYSFISLQTSCFI